MRTLRAWTFTASLSLLVVGPSSCLPADTRPPPSTVLIDVAPNDVGAGPIATIDGWSITVDRFLVSIGDVSASDDCLNYSDAHYNRIIDGMLAEDQKLSVLFPFGKCDLRYQISPPDNDTLLGAGVTKDEALRLGAKESDPYVMQPAGISIDIAATAERGQGETERLHWSFRQQVPYGNCRTPVDGTPTTPLDFPSGAQLTYHLVLEPDTLLRDDKDGAAALRFDTIATADSQFGNHDGEVTFDELAQIPIEVARQTGPYSLDAVDPMNPITAVKVQSLADYVYLVLAPKIPRFRESILCERKPTRMRD